MDSDGAENLWEICEGTGGYVEVDINLKKGQLRTL